MLLTRISLWMLLFTTLLISVNAQSYMDDSLAVVEILTANNLGNVLVSDVSSKSGGRISSLHLENRGLRVLPECIGKLDSLRDLSISQNNLQDLPQSIGNLSRLEFLSCYDNNICELPSTFSQLQKLNTVYLIRNRLTHWPDVFYSMPNLTMIDVGGNHLTNIPDSISRCKTLKELYINDNYILQLPESITQIDLKVVHVAGNALCNTSQVVKNWLDLHDYYLSLRDYKIDMKWSMYQGCGYFYSDSLKVRELLDKNGWTDIPVDSVITMQNGGITGINISYGKRTTLKSMSKTSSMEVQKMVFPSGIEQFKHLRSLDLAGNNLDTLPDWFYKLCHLENLDLSKNHLTTLPDFMAAFCNLSSINLAGNEIKTVSEKVSRWADKYAPEWKNTLLGTGTFSERFDKNKNVSRRMSVMYSGRTAAIQVRFDNAITAEIAIYSISGRLIKSLAKKHFEPGVYDFYPENAQLHNGIYLITVKSGCRVMGALEFIEGRFPSLF